MNAAPLTSQPCADSELLTFPALARLPGFAHAVSTRPWNLAPHRGPDAHRARERRRQICDHLGLDFDRLTAPDQVHSHHVIRVRPADVGRGRDGRDSALRFVDGLVCDLPGVPLLQLSADCPLILVVDPRRRAFGTAHASWRGTVGRIAEQLVAQMVREFDSRPAELWAGLCPCAGADRYEVGEEILRVAEPLLPDAAQYFPRRGDRYSFDLKRANYDQLLRAGLPAGQISIAAECTLSDPRFFSHRRDGDATGRFGLIAAWREDA
ncbi:MAG: polyphenol oxidase family protein [Phycisphaerae bacterium]